MAQRRTQLYNQCREYYHSKLNEGLSLIFKENRQFLQSRSSEYNLIHSAEELSRKHRFTSEEEALPFFEEVWKESVEQMEKQISTEGEKEADKLYRSLVRLYNKEGSWQPEMKHYFSLLKEAAQKGKEKQELKSILPQMKSTLVLFD